MTGKEAPNRELLENLASPSLADEPTQVPQNETTEGTTK